MSKLNLGIKACGVFLLWAAAAISLPAQTTAGVPPPLKFTTIYSFDQTCTDGCSPYAGLVQGADGKFYGTTEGGTVFRVTTSGKLTTLHRFEGPDGFLPEDVLVQGTDGSFYGTTWSGGANNDGTVFKITPRGKLTTLHSFDEADGAGPMAGLIKATNGNFYGTTQAGGADCAPTYGCGTIFSITPSGKLTTLYSFCALSNCSDGNQPQAALVQGTNGDFYGTTLNGGASISCNTSDGCGTIFKITPSGKLTTLHSFCSESVCGDGDFPYAGLVQATDGNFYGTTFDGGDNNEGTVFKITPGGKLTTLHSFHETDGRYPFAALVQGNDGNFYGTTSEGGKDNTTDCLDVGCGTVFTITPGGTLATLYRFEGPDGSIPDAGLVQGTNGDFYGTTKSGGANNGNGTVFSLSVGLGPFVETQPTSGAVGAAVKILGTNLTGATSVTFNGTAATFAVKSKSLITTTVPTGATTGTVQVVTPSGTLSSNAPFRVR